MNHSKKKQLIMSLYVFNLHHIRAIGISPIYRSSLTDVDRLKKHYGCALFPSRLGEKTLRLRA